MRFQEGRLTLEQLRATGEGSDLRLRATLDTGPDKPTLDARISGTTDAAALALLIPDPGLAGRLTLDVSASGPLGILAYNV